MPENLTCFKMNNTYKIIIHFFITIVLVTPNSFAQNASKEEWENKYTQENLNYTNGNISELQYITVIDSLTEQLTVAGLSYTNEQLAVLLDLYKSIIWSSKEHQQFKPRYFRFLMNNSLGNGRSGEALFYADKNEKELIQLGKKSFLIPYMKLLIWAKSNNNAKVVALYGEERENLLSLFKKKPDISNIAEYLQGMQFYFFAIKPLLKENSEWVKEIANNAIKLDSLIQVHLPYLEETKVSPSLPKLLSLFCNIEYAAYNDDRLKEKALLDSAAFILNNATSKLGVNQGPFENGFYSMALNYYLKVKDNKNAENYLNKMLNSVKIFDDEQSELFKYKASLSFNKGDYKDAYTFTDSALFYKSQEVTIAYNEMTNLLYAHAESEYNKNELRQAEITQKRQVVGIAGISLFALVLAVFAYLKIKKEKRKALKQMMRLNQMADITVEEAKQHAAKEEQRKLGQDLHDDLSASLISAIHTIELATQKANQLDVSTDLKELKTRVGIIYESIRNKSHQIYKQVSDEDNDHFEESVKKITDAVFSNAVYSTDIEIDKSVSAELNMQQRIELLRILQEAAANILKHSKATAISIFLFRNNDKVMFQIGDNGIGLNMQKLGFGIGLESIKKRAQVLKGELEVINNEGTTLIISFPTNIL